MDQMWNIDRNKGEGDRHWEQITNKCKILRATCFERKGRGICPASLMKATAAAQERLRSSQTFTDTVLHSTLSRTKILMLSNHVSGDFASVFRSMMRSSEMSRASNETDNRTSHVSIWELRVRWISVIRYSVKCFWEPFKRFDSCGPQVFVGGLMLLILHNLSVCEDRCPVSLHVKTFSSQL